MVAKVSPYPYIPPNVIYPANTTVGLTGIQVSAHNLRTPRIKLLYAFLALVLALFSANSVKVEPLVTADRKFVFGYPGNIILEQM